MTRERARAVAARRLVPWVVGSAVAAGVLVAVAGGGLRGALTIGALGLLLAVFVLALSVPRCPRCGAPLPGARAEPAAGASGGGRCPRCEREA